jgi:hypothetical protein
MGLGGVDWIGLALDRYRWRPLQITIMPRCTVALTMPLTKQLHTSLVTDIFTVLTLFHL